MSLINSILFTFGLISYPIYFGPESKTDPNNQEVLNTPINLNNCAGVKIIEWRPTIDRESTTSPSEESISVVEEACGLALSSFPEFINHKNLVKTNNSQFFQFISLMPVTRQDGGFENRNLNDTNRFDIDKKPNHLLKGWTSHSTNKIFLLNEPINNNALPNSEFVKVLVHELFHSMSWHYGTYVDSSTDERLAREFTEYLGLGK